jgi:hypothetical protein
MCVLSWCCVQLQQLSKLLVAYLYSGKHPHIPWDESHCSYFNTAQHSNPSEWQLEMQ